MAGRPHTLSNKVGREVVLKEFDVLEGIVQLGVGHAARLEPAIKHLVHSSQHALALLAGNLQVVDEMPVQVRHLPATVGTSTHDNLNEIGPFLSSSAADTVIIATAFVRAVRSR